MAQLCSSPTLHMKQALKSRGALLIKYSVASSSNPKNEGVHQSCRRYSSVLPKKKILTKKERPDINIQPMKVNPKNEETVTEKRTPTPLHRDIITSILDKFLRNLKLRQQANQEQGITEVLFLKAFLSFRTYCLELIPTSDPELVEKFRNVAMSKASEEILYENFVAHAKKVFPHLNCLGDLKIISDLTMPHNWYPVARTLKRRFIYHAGPTNSGKTWAALQAFKASKSGVYCGPLRLLANEIYRRMNNEGLPCDLVTGEERRFAIDNLHPSSHLSCTVEMLPTDMRTELAVIDEIQMLRDDQRGWAWSRALLGAAADEVHLCGEASAIPIVTRLLKEVDEEVEVNRYERKTKLSISTHGLGELENVQHGDCIVCFSKRQIFMTTKELESRGKQCSVIYGDLPPGTKIRQAEKFNDPDDPTNVLVATDAIGMGLNLNIKRIIFNSLKRMGNTIPHHSAIQIAGRAGRYGTAYEEGVVLTKNEEDIQTLKELLGKQIDDIEKVGIAPTFDQIETFAFLLPKASFIDILTIFKSVCSVRDDFFLCELDQMIDLAKSISDIQLPLKIKYIFCVVPVNMDSKQGAAAFIKMAKRYSMGQQITQDWLCSVIEWPPKVAVNMDQLVNLERTYDILDAYLW
uniref:RNA helicase n=1 Tax=Acrobeloides nanus TaxID=290746 RepID=A0A914EFP7_9BILA